MTEQKTASGAGVSRRGVLKAAAWSTPVVAVAVAAPFASASSGKLPSDYAVTAGIGGQANEGATNAGNIWVTTGSVTLHGKAGDTSGALTAIINVPANYQASFGTTPGGAAIVVGDTLDGWTVSSISGTTRKTITLTHPAITIPSGSTSTTTSFPAVYLTLANGATGAPIPGASNTSARFRIGAGTINGGQYAADSFFPALEDN